MNQDNLKPSTSEQFKSSISEKQYSQDLKTAYTSEKQGQILAGHVLGMIKDGEIEGRAKLSRIPLASPRADMDSVTLATNAALKERGVDVVVDAYSGQGYDSTSDRVIVTSVDGEAVPAPDNLTYVKPRKN